MGERKGNKLLESRTRLKESRARKRSERAKKRAQKEAERKRPEYPRISLKSILYCMNIYAKAVGPKRYFFWFYRVVSSAIPAWTAVLAGNVVTEITRVIETGDFTPFIVAVIFLISVQLVNVILSAVYHLLSISVNQEVFIYVSEMVATKYIQIPLAQRESREFADKFERVRDFGGSIDFVASSAITVISSVVGLMSVVIATLTASPLITIAVVLAAIPSSILSLRLAARERRNWREFTKDRRIAWQIERKITNSDSALEIELNGLSKTLVEQMIKARRRSQEQDIADNKAFGFFILLSLSVMLLCKLSVRGASSSTQFYCLILTYIIYIINYLLLI